jgi:hypothetical protein
MTRRVTEALAASDQKAELFSKWLALVLATAAVLVFISGRIYGPHLSEMALSDGLCGFAKGHFVYVGIPSDHGCDWVLTTESHAWASSDYRGRSVLMRASWNAGQVKLDGRVFVIGDYHEPTDNRIAQIYEKYWY